MKGKLRAVTLGCAVFFLGLALQGCDILRSSPFMVSSWNPGEGSHQDFTGPGISLEFSHEPDRYSVERSLSCTEDGLPLSGTFVWEGRRLSFFPAGGIRANRDYRINLSTDAQDTEGLSLDTAFEGTFSTRPDMERLVLTGSSPADGGSLVNSGGAAPGPCFEAFVLNFSRAVGPEHLYQYVSFSPSIRGLWQVSSDASDLTTAHFTPSEAWQNGRSYICTISADLPDKYDRPMGRTYSIHFTVGDDREPPVLVSIQALDAGGNAVQDLAFSDFEGETGPSAPVPLNEHFEISYGLTLEFSEPVDPATVKNRLFFQPALGFTLSPPYPESASFTVRFTDKPVYGTTYTLSLARAVADGTGNTSTRQVLCSFLVNGEGSKPPRFAGIRLPLAPGAAAGSEDPVAFGMDSAYGNLAIQAGSDQYPYEIPTNTWIELYFEAAPGAGIDLFSLMNSLNISATNSCLSFSPRKVIDSGFTWTDPEPGWEGLVRVEVQGLLTNRTDAGILTVSLSADLADTLGNRAGQSWSLPLCK